MNGKLFLRCHNLFWGTTTTKNFYQPRDFQAPGHAKVRYKI